MSLKTRYVPCSPLIQLVNWMDAATDMFINNSVYDWTLGLYPEKETAFKFPWDLNYFLFA